MCGKHGGAHMSIRFVIATLGVIAGGMPGAVAETVFDITQERALTDQERLAILASPAYDVVKGSARVIVQAVACGDAPLAAKAQAVAEAALASEGARPTQSMVAAAEAKFARDPQSKAEIAKDCPTGLKKAAVTLAELTQQRLAVE